MYYPMIKKNIFQRILMMYIPLPGSIPFLLKEVARMGTDVLVVMRRRLLSLGSACLSLSWAAAGARGWEEPSWLETSGWVEGVLPHQSGAGCGLTVPSEWQFWPLSARSLSRARSLAGWLAGWRACVRVPVPVRVPAAARGVLQPLLSSRHRMVRKCPLTIADKQHGLCYVTSDCLAVGLDSSLPVGCLAHIDSYLHRYFAHGRSRYMSAVASF